MESNFFCFFFNDTATTEIYTGWYTLSLHDALPISTPRPANSRRTTLRSERCPTAPRSEEHTSELQSHHPISYAVFCLKKKNQEQNHTPAGRSLRSLGLLSGQVHQGCCPGGFFFNDTATTEIYTGWYTLSLHDALPI